MRRQVALKILRTAVAGRQARARFEAERHAMGRLDHPNVGKILDAGTTDDGVPYFAMELIDGIPVTTFCDERSLGLEDRLRLFIDVCSGVDHAHRKLLLHRDLKPSNVLVTEIDGRAVPKVIDLGIAKGLDSSLADPTLATGDRIIGTPAYMSPEALGQGGDVDQRSDVFSLGVVLYELLTGLRPWAEVGDTPLDALRRSADDQVARPSTRVTTLEPDTGRAIAARRGERAIELSKRLRGDLDWIALKAIAFDPSERYGSAAELAADLERFLASEPVSARAPTLGYLLHKLMRRHRGCFVAAALIAASLVVGFIGTSVGFVRARTEACRADLEAEAAEQALDRALLAQQGSDRLAGFLESLLGEVDSSLENPDQLTARQILERGTVGLASELSDQPFERAALLGAVAGIHARWENFGQAEALLEEARDLLNTVGPWAGRPNEAIGQTRIDILEKVADLRFREGRFDEAYSSAVAALAADPEDSSQGARLEIQAGSALRMMNRLEEASERLSRGLSILETAPGASPASPDILAEIYLELGSVAHRRLDPQGLDYFRRAVAVLEEAYGTDSRRVVPALSRLSYGLVDSKAYPEAETVLHRIIDLEERLYGSKTGPVARSLYLLGRVFSYQEDYPAAESAFRKSVEIRQSLSAEKHPLIANASALLAYMIWLQEDGRQAEVAALFATAEANLSGNDTVYPVFTAVMELRARIAAAESRPEEAEVFVRRAIDYLQHLEESPMSHVSATFRELAKSLFDQGRLVAAQEACQESLQAVLEFGKEARILRRRQELLDLGCDLPDPG